jgi:hypothetical protein
VPDEFASKADEGVTHATGTKQWYRIARVCGVGGRNGRESSRAVRTPQLPRTITDNGVKEATRERWFEDGGDPAVLTHSDEDLLYRIAPI